MEAWEHLQPVVKNYIARACRDGLVSLSPTEQVVYLVWCYPGAINNGGHASFFYNSYGEFAQETVAALQELGMPEYADVLRKAIVQFPGQRVPRNIDERNRLFNSLPERAHSAMGECDSAFYALGDEALMARLLEYWRCGAA